MSKLKHLEKRTNNEKKTGRLNFRHLILGLIASSFCLSLSAQEMVQQLTFEQLNPNYKSRTRAPSNFIPNDEIWGAPVENKEFIQKIFVETDEGTLRNANNQFIAWEETAEYARLWNLETTGLYVVPDQKARKAFFDRQLLRYADKRLSGEVKHAEEGSTLHAVGQAQKALSPNAEATILPSVKLKFKARVLQGKAFMIIDNPYVDAVAQINMQGEASMNVKRQFASVGMATEVDYQVSTETWVARVDKSITDRITARVSSAQSQNDMAFSNESNRTIELVFGMLF